MILVLTLMVCLDDKIWTHGFGFGFGWLKFKCLIW